MDSFTNNTNGTIATFSGQQELPAFNPKAFNNDLWFKTGREFTLNMIAKKADHQLRRGRDRYLRKLRGHKAAHKAKKAATTIPTKAIPGPLVPSYSDAEGLRRAKELLPRDAPRQIFSADSLEARCRWYGYNPKAHNLVKENVLKHSTFMTTIDLRDDRFNNPDGKTIKRGAIYDDADIMDEVRHVNVQIWAEMAGNYRRSKKEVRNIANKCRRLQSMHIEIIGSDSRAVAREIADKLYERQWRWTYDDPPFKLTYSASRYDEEE